MNVTKKMFWMIAALTVTFIAIGAGQVNAVVVFSEDFEAAGATILDIGWDSPQGVSDIAIETTSPLNGTRVARGPHTVGALTAATHDVATPTAGLIYTLTADTFFNEVQEHSNGIGLVSSTMSANGWTNDDGAYILQDTTEDALKFDSSFLGGHQPNSQTFPDGVGLGVAAQVTIRLDMAANTATGIVTDASGTYTIVETIPAGDVAKALSLDRVSMMQRYSGFDVDNILVTETPEPSTLALVAAGLLCLNLVGWRKRS